MRVQDAENVSAISFARTIFHRMPKEIILLVLLAYFVVLLVMSYYTGRSATNQAFFQANKSAKWYLVAFGMVGTSLSGVTFISVPGTVGTADFAYFQIVIGYFIGYFVVAFVLLPLYYRYNLTSIYNYLGERFGMYSYKTGALFFIVSRTLGATLRLYLVIAVLQATIMEDLKFPFAATAVIILGMILLYTFKGGVKTIVWTDTLQTFFMLLALVVCAGYIINNLGFSFSTALNELGEAGYTSIFNADPMSGKFFLKQIIGGAFITISMTGLDQEMMQKNISVRTLADSQKNMVSFSVILVAVNFLFLVLGGMLYLYAVDAGAEFQKVMMDGRMETRLMLDNVNVMGDALFPTLAMDYLPGIISLLFIVGLISALFPSADGALTALTSSFCIDILGMQRDTVRSEKQKSKRRIRIHIAFALVFLMFVFLFRWINDRSIIDFLLYIANFTYGPLLGLFAFGILTRRTLRDNIAPAVCIVAPLLTLLIDKTSSSWLGDYKFGSELLVLNGLLTFFGLYFFSHNTDTGKKPKPLA